jgi:hypothetical protein
MKKLRKVNSQQRKADRRAAQELERRTSFFLSLPEECCLCELPFERNHETVKTWNVTVFEKKKKIRLTCPACWETVQTVVKENQNV